MENKLNKKDYIYLFTILLSMGFIIFIMIKFKYIYGSYTDWISQHWAIPDYFRKLFYDTGNLIPSFAPNIGGGQNIYYFSYYGLLNPIILISYLLPWVSMRDYIITSSIILVVISIILMYKWLKQYFNPDICFCSTFLFMCSGPLIFHSHRHIMFINYMPFLILALFSVDYYFKHHKRGYLISITVFLIIMTSYFYSVGSLIFLSLYALGKYLDINKNNLSKKKLFKDALSFCGFIILGIMLASIILLPTMYVLLNGRDKTAITSDLKSLLIPQINLQYVLYSAYSLGVGFLGITSFLYGVISKKTHIKILSITILLLCSLDILIYLLNGTLYINSKTLIPFLPFATLIIADTLKHIKLKEFNILFLILSCILGYISIFKALSDHDEYLILFTLDVILTTTSILWIKKFDFKLYKYFPILIISFLACIGTNKLDKLIPKDYYTDKSYIDNFELSNNISTSDTEIYRIGNTTSYLHNINMIYNTNYYQSTLYSSTLNDNYKDFYFNQICNENRYRNSATLSQSESILFDMYMSNKYIISKDIYPTGYSKVQQQGDISLYKNLDVFPLGYISPNVMPKTQYDTLKYPENLEALMTYAIVDDDIPYVDFNINIKPIDLEYKVNNSNNLKISKKDNIYYLNNLEDTDISLKLNKHLDGDTILLIRFYVDNTKNSMNNDVSVTINGIKNKLCVPTWRYYNNNTSFEYVVSCSNGIDTLDISFSKGIYQISNVETYTLDYNILKEYSSTLDRFNFNTTKTSGDTIYGDIKASKNGYLQLSIPYDNGFTFFVDGKKQDCIKLDNSFIGIPITKGYHTIEINFKAPYLNISLIVSSFGLLILLILIFKDTFSKKSNKE